MFTIPFTKRILKVKERTTATLTLDGHDYIIDVCNDGPTLNPWYVAVDELLPDGDYIDLYAAHCEGSLDVCNGDTLMAYWLDETEDYHARYNGG